MSKTRCWNPIHHHRVKRLQSRGLRIDLFAFAAIATSRHLSWMAPAVIVPTFPSSGASASDVRPSR